MIVLGLRTDKPEAELYIYKDGQKLADYTWQAHLKLAETLSEQIEKILNKLSISYKDLDGVAVFKGPGSFTGLRIGMSVANALAFGLQIPIAARAGNTWLSQAIKDLSNGQDDRVAMPEYGAPAHTTKPKK